MEHWGDYLADSSESDSGSDDSDSWIDSIAQGFSSLIEFLTQILSYINPFSENFFGYKLIDLFSDLLTTLFVPDDDSITAISDTISEKFGFIDSIKLCIETIQNMINNIENGTSDFTIGIESDYYTGEVTLFNLSWYSKFKTYGDLVFTGFAYVFFVFRLYKSIPSILSGASSLSGFFSGGDDE